MAREEPVDPKDVQRDDQFVTKHQGDPKGFEKAVRKQAKGGKR